MPLVVVPGPFGGSVSRPLAGAGVGRCIGCASFGFGYRRCAGEQLIVQVIAGFLRIAASVG